MSKSSAQQIHMGGHTCRTKYCDVIKMKNLIKFFTELKLFSFQRTVVRETVIEPTFLDYTVAKVSQALWDFITKAACGTTIKRNLSCIQYI